MLLENMGIISRSHSADVGPKKIHSYLLVSPKSCFILGITSGLSDAVLQLIESGSKQEQALHWVVINIVFFHLKQTLPAFYSMLWTSCSTVRCPVECPTFCVYLLASCGVSELLPLPSLFCLVSVGCLRHSLCSSAFCPYRVPSVTL